MFVVCGEALFDVFVENNPALDSNTLELSARVGGSPFNVAVGLARLGRKSSLLTGVSTDFFGDRLTAVLEKEKVSTSFLAKKSGPTTLGFVEKGDDGQPSYAFYGRGAADRSLQLADIEMDFSSVQCIHLGSYSIVVPPTADTLGELIRRESDHRIVSLDPNIRPTVEPDMALWRTKISSLVTQVDIVKASDEDLEYLYPGRALESVMEEWLSKGAHLVAITRGGEGALLMSKQVSVEVTAPGTEVVDTVGAGDTFQTGLLDQIVKLSDENGGKWQEMLDADNLQKVGRFSSAAASITCSRQGADLPNRDEVNQLLSRWD